MFHFYSVDFTESEREINTVQRTCLHRDIVARGGVECKKRNEQREREKRVRESEKRYRAEVASCAVGLLLLVIL